jgi:hypothetical protein
MTHNLYVYLGSQGEGGEVQVRMSGDSYLHGLGGGSYRLGMVSSSSQRMILGANFMHGYNIIFDTQGNRVGFAPSTCNYELYRDLITTQPTSSPSNPSYEPTSAMSMPSPAKVVDAADNSKSSSKQHDFKNYFLRLTKDPHVVIIGSLIAIVVGVSLSLLANNFHNVYGDVCNQ